MKVRRGSGPLPRSRSIFDLPPRLLPSRLPPACTALRVVWGAPRVRSRELHVPRRGGAEATEQEAGEGVGRVGGSSATSRMRAAQRSPLLDAQHRAETCVPFSSCSSSPTLIWLVCFLKMAPPWSTAQERQAQQTLTSWVA